MTPMTVERLAEIRTAMSDRGYIDNESAAELLDEVERLRAIPSEVAAAMEAYSKHLEANGKCTSPYFNTKTGHDDRRRLDDVLAIAAHFTALFQKGTP